MISFLISQILYLCSYYAQFFEAEQLSCFVKWPSQPPQNVSVEASARRFVKFVVFSLI